MLRAACDARGIAFTTIGLDREEPAPERIFVSYDVVFATGRSAIEALAAGSAVIVCDAYGLGGLVTPETYGWFRRHNFALRSLIHAVTPGTVGAALDGYDRCHAEAVVARIRAEADLDLYLDRLIALYRRAIAEHRADPPGESAIRDAMQRFLHDALPRPSFSSTVIPAEPDTRPNHMAELVAALIANQAELATLRSALETSETSQAEAAAALAAAEARLAAERTASRELLAAIYRSTSWPVTAPGRWLGSVLTALRHPSLRYKRHSSK